MWLSLSPRLHVATQAAGGGCEWRWCLSHSRCPAPGEREREENCISHSQLSSRPSFLPPLPAFPSGSRIHTQQSHLLARERVRENARSLHEMVCLSLQTSLSLTRGSQEPETTLAAHLQFTIAGARSATETLMCRSFPRHMHTHSALVCTHKQPANNSTSSRSGKSASRHG